MTILVPAKRERPGFFLNNGRLIRRMLSSPSFAVPVNTIMPRPDRAFIKRVMKRRAKKGYRVHKLLCNGCTKCL